MSKKKADKRYEEYVAKLNQSSSGSGEDHKQEEVASPDDVEIDINESMMSYTEDG